MHRKRRDRTTPPRVRCVLDTGPFDIVGDVHGCFDELCELLGLLGYEVEPRQGSPGWVVSPPGERKLVFVGDLVDRGPRIPDVLRLAMGMVAERKARCVPGNHDDKLMRKLMGHQVQIKHGLEQSLAQLGEESDEFRLNVLRFLERLPTHLVLDGGSLVVAHAGLPEDYHGRTGSQVRQFALYGDTASGRDEYGLPIRYNWGAYYRGSASVV